MQITSNKPLYQQNLRKKSIRYKLNPIPLEFKGKNVLLVDDSIVRGNTSRKIVEMAREAGAKKVYFASAAPPIVNPDVYGIDMPTRAELIATNNTIPQIAKSIGVDKLYYQKINRGSLPTLSPRGLRGPGSRRGGRRGESRAPSGESEGCS